MKDKEWPSGDSIKGNMYWLNVIIRLAEVSKSIKITENLWLILIYFILQTRYLPCVWQWISLSVNGVFTHFDI